MSKAWTSDNTGDPRLKQVIDIHDNGDLPPLAVFRKPNPYTIYLSGPMTGLPDFNSAEFAKYAEKYRAKGWRVLSPPELDAGDHGQTYEFYIRRDVRVLLDENVAAMYMLPGWQQSKGAKLEKHIADLFKIPVFDVTTDKPWSESVTQEAYRLVHGNRGDDYGHPFDDFGRTAGMLNSLLKHKLASPLAQEDIAMMMIAVKLSRLANTPDHRDSVVDLGGYAETYWMVRERRREIDERERNAATVTSTGLSG